MDFSLRSVTTRGSDKALWLKLTLDQIRCVKEVLRYFRGGSLSQTWTCSENDCNNCQSVNSDCKYYNLTVSTEEAGAASDLPSFPDCKYGDVVKLERIRGDPMYVAEIAVIEKQGKSNSGSLHLVTAMVPDYMLFFKNRSHRDKLNAFCTTNEHTHVNF